MDVICIDAKGKPNEIPELYWLVEGKPYTVVQADRLISQNGIMGYKLAELNIDHFSPYEYFDARRFAILLKQEQIEILMKAA